MDKRHIAIAIVGLGCAVVAGYFLIRSPSFETRVGATSPSPAAIGTAARQTGMTLQGVRVYPASATARARLTPNPLDEQDLGGMVLTERFDELAARARKDPAFAQSFAFALHQCAIQKRSYKLLLDRMDKMTDEQAAAEVAKNEATFAKCKGLTDAQMAYRFELAEQAARAGVLQAQLYYSNYVSQAIQDGTAVRTPGAMDRYRSNNEAFVLAAAQSGDPEGLYAAYNLYSQGKLVSRDMVRAYQFAEQYARLNPQVGQRMLTRLARRMSADEQSRARAGQP